MIMKDYADYTEEDLDKLNGDDWDWLLEEQPHLSKYKKDCG